MEGADGPCPRRARAPRAGGEWRVDPGLLRAIAVLGGVVVVLAWIAVLLIRDRRWRCGVVVAAAIAVTCALVVPATLMQIGLRDGTAQWFYTNDSAYQIELGGDLVLHGHSPYGRDYAHTGMERLYHLDGTPPNPGEQIVALGHFPYFRGMALFGAGARLLPSPFDDVRFLVMLCTLALLPAAMLLRGPFPVRLAIGAVLAANPLSVRAAWFGTADAPAVLALGAGVRLHAAASLHRGAGADRRGRDPEAVRDRGAPVRPARGVARRRPPRAGATAGGAARRGAGAVARVRGRRPGRVLERHDHVRRLDLPRDRVRPRRDPRQGRHRDRTGSYPFPLIALLTWLPVTGALLWLQRRDRAPWMPAAGFAASMFMLVFIARVFQTSYLIYPLAGLCVAAVAACWSPGASPPERRLDQPAAPPTSRRPHPASARERAQHAGMTTTRARLRGGIDLGGTKIQAASWTTADHAVLGAKRDQTPLKGGPKAIAARMAGCCASRREEAGLDDRPRGRRRRLAGQRGRREGHRPAR